MHPTASTLWIAGLQYTSYTVTRMPSQKRGCSLGWWWTSGEVPFQTLHGSLQLLEHLLPYANLFFPGLIDGVAVRAV
jgi:hypothetical protein